MCPVLDQKDLISRLGASLYDTCLILFSQILVQKNTVQVTLSYFAKVFHQSLAEFNVIQQCGH